MFVNETAYWVNETQPFANETDMQGIPVYDWEFNLILIETEVDETATTADDASTDAADTDAPTAAEDRRQLHEGGKFMYHEHLTTPHNHTITDEEGNVTIVEMLEEEKVERLEGQTGRGAKKPGLDKASARNRSKVVALSGKNKKNPSENEGP